MPTYKKVMTPNEKPIDNKTKVQSKRQYVELSCFFEAYKVEKVFMKTQEFLTVIELSSKHISSKHITLIQVHGTWLACDDIMSIDVGSCSFWCFILDKRALIKWNVPIRFTSIMNLTSSNSCFSNSSGTYTPWLQLSQHKP